MKKLLAVLGVVGVSVLVVGCPSFPSACDYGGCLDADGSTSETGPGPDVVIPDAGPDSNVPNPPGCESVKEPLKNPEKCFTDEVWAFVSPTGNDANPGTKAQPYKTIGKALEGAKPLIVACEGTYGESLGIGRTVGLYGGVACDFGKAGGATTIASGKAVGLTASQGAVTLNGVNVTATDAATAGESSVGVLAESGVVLTVIGGTVTAGAGAAGGAGTTGTNYDVALDASDPKIKGNNASGNMGGAKQTCAALCAEAPAVAVEGGEGGVGGGTGGAPGGDGKTVVAGSEAFGKGGTYQTVPVPACGNGIQGVAGRAANGGAGATTPGSVEGGKWQVSRGASGETARPGQGGGGGSGGASAAVGGGGGGGCGGCGGAKGQGGQSGGSSFGVLSLGATVTLENVTVKAGVGGKGGAGSAGQTGQAGGLAGLQAGAGIGCPGGSGGQGGQGGGGGGGAGGHSVAVAYSGTKPTQKSVTAEPATAAAKGGDPGSTGAGATAATAGADGKTAAELSL